MTSHVVIGDPTVFAIEAERFGEWDSTALSKQLRFRLWISSEPVGDYDNTVVAATTVQYLREFTERAVARHCAPFAVDDSARILDEVYDWVYGQDAPVQTSRLLQIELSMAFRGYVLSEVALPSLEMWRIVGIRYSQAERLIWSADDPAGGTRDVRLRADRFDAAIKEFVDWAEAE